VSTSTHTRFDYGPERARTRQVKVQGATTTTIKYVGTLFEQVAKTGAATEYVNYVFAGERRVAVYARDNGATPNEAVRYLHQDHLGSVDTITDESGGVVERLSYDAWGKRRTASGEDAWKDSVIPITAATTPRGFTDHEHLDDFELVHMNGRVYEPVLGRFLSPDPFVQYPESTQGFNRYTYAVNNPLSFTDPNGYWVENLDEDDEIYDDDDWNAYDWGDDLPTDDYTDGQANCPCHPGNSPQVSNPATGQPVPTSSGSPHGVNQAGVGGLVGGGYIFDVFAELFDDDVREAPRVMLFLGFTDMSRIPRGVATHSLVIGMDPKTGKTFATAAGPESGFLKAVSGQYNENFRDPPESVHTKQFVGVLDVSLEGFVSRAEEFTDMTNEQNVPYLGFTSNSNSYAFTFLETLGFERPKPTLSAP